MNIKEQIKEIINREHEHKSRYSDTVYRSPGTAILRDEDRFTSEGIEFRQVEQFGGEGQGDNYWIVFSSTRDNKTQFWMVPGWHASHVGSELSWAELYEVKRVQKVVDDWEEV